MASILAFATFVTAMPAMAQTTYTWNQTVSAPWTTASSWTPTRTTPQTTDVLVVNGTNTPAAIITDVPTQTIGRLRLINGASVTASATSNSRVVTLNGAGTPALDIGAGSTLAIQGTRAIELALASGATATIAGNVSFQDAANRLTSPDAGAITFTSGAGFTTLTGFTGNPFNNTGTAGIAVFQSGSTYTHNAGGDPFGLAAPASKVVFQSGSTFVVRSAAGFVASGRTYGNLTIDNNSAPSTSGTGAFQFQTLLVKTGSSFTHAGSGAAAITISGDITSSGTGNIAITGGSGGTTFTGAGTRTIGGGTGTGGVSLNGTITVPGGTTLALSRAIGTTGTLSVNGTLQVNSSGGVSGTVVYGPGTGLIFNNTTGVVTVSGSTSYWPAASGPANVTVLSGAGVGLAAGTSRTVTGTFRTGAAFTGGVRLTVNGLLQMDAGGTMSGAPTYGSTAALVYGSGSFTAGPEWGSGAVTGVGVPRDVVIRAAGGTVTMPASDRTVPRQLTIGSGTLALSATAGNLMVGGDWSDSGSVATNGRTVVLNGAGAQGVGRVGGETFGVLQISKSAGAVTLGSNVTVTSGVQLGTTRVVTGANELRLGTGATLTRTSGLVDGTLRKPVPAGVTSVLYELGTGATYTPVTLAFGNVTAAGTIATTVTAGDHPALGSAPIDPTRSVNRWWQFANSGVAFQGCTATFNYVAADLDPGVTASQVEVGAYDAPVWSAPALGVVTATSAQATQLASLHDFAVGEFLPHTITATAGANGSVTPSGPVSVAHHGSQTFTIAPGAHYHIGDVAADSVSVGAVASYAFTNVVANHRLDVVFAVDRQTVTVTADSNGAVTRSPDSPDYAYGSVVQLTAVAVTGYHFAGWGGDATGTANPLSLTVDGNKAVTAAFAINTYPLDVTIGGSGTVTRSPSLSAYPHGSVVQLNAYPAAGYAFGGWSGDASGSATPVFVTMTGPRAVHADFTVGSFPVLVNVVGFGSVTRSPDQPSYTFGTVVTLTATPGPGAHFIGWSGSVNGASNPITLTVDGSKSVTAAFDSSGFNYVLSRYAGSYSAISPAGGAGTVLVAAHDSTRSIPLPFPFRYAGNYYTTNNWLAISANGYAQLSRDAITSNSSAASANSNLYSPADPNNTLAPWYDDLAVTAVGTNPAGQVLYQTSGSVGSRKLTVQWTDVSSYFNINVGQPRRINFQLVLYEGTGVIDFRYGPISGTDFSSLESASIGIEDSIGGNNHYIDAITGSRLTSFGMMTTNKWPTRNVRFTPGTTTPIPAGTLSVGLFSGYPSISEAFADMNQRGISGPVTLELTNAFYDTTTAGGHTVFPLLLGPVSGADSVNTITIESNAGSFIRDRGTDAGLCGNQTIPNAIGITNEPVIAVLGADYVTIRNLTIEGGNAVDRGLLLTNSSRSDGTQHALVYDVFVTLDRSNMNSIGVQQIASVAPTGPDGTNSYNRFLNMTVENAYSGIALTGSGSAFDVACEIGGAAGTGNQRTTVGGSAPGDIGGGAAPVFGVRAVNQFGLLLRSTEVRNLLGTGVGNVDGIDVESQGVLTPSHGVLEVSGNLIHDLSNSSPAAGRVTGLRVAATANATSTILAYNNMVYGLESASTSTLSRKVVGILAQESSNGIGGTLDIDFNSVRLESSRLACPNTCFEIGTTSGPVINVRNNILANFTPAQSGAAGHYCWVTPSATATGAAGSKSDRNVLFVADPGRGFTGRAGNVDRATIADWRAATGTDADSRTENPRFVGPANLAIDPTVPTPVESFGSYFGGAISWVHDDIGGDPRDPVTPDLGADEGNFIPLDLYDVQAVAVLAPSGTNLVAGAPFTPQASFFNKGVANLTNVPLRFRIIGPAPATDTVYNRTVNLASFPTATTQTVSFPAGSLPLAGTYTLEAVSELASDVRPANNLASGSFAQNWTLQVQVTGNGTVARNPSQAVYAPGTVVTLTATPATGWHFVGWTGDASGTSPITTVTMNAHRNVVATFAIDTFTLALTATSGGAVQASPALASYPYGTAVSVTATPANGYHFTGWTGDTTTANPTLALTMVANRSFTANFVINTYSLDVTIAGQGVVTKSPDQPAYPHGTAVTLTATPATGWHFAGWTGDTTAAANPLALTMTASRTLTATFAINTYTLGLGSDGNGVVQRQPDQTLYPHGTVVTVTAVPNDGYHFEEWNGDLSGTDNPATLVMDTNKTVFAMFGINVYTLSVTTTGNGTVSKSPNQGLYPHGTVVTLTATPATGWHFVRWSGDTTTTTNPLALTMTSNHSLTATFAINVYSLQVSVTGTGFVDINPDQGGYPHGTVVTLTASAPTGWHFQDWGASGNANPLTITMNSDKAITATFVLNHYTLAVTASGNGTVNKTPNAATYDYGSQVQISATPAVGWHFVSWTGDTTSSANPLMLNIDRNRAITGNFAINTYALTVTVTGQGTVAKSPDQPQYDHGTVVTLTATPAVGWHFIGWSGDATGAASPVTVTMDAAKSVTATFAINTYPLTVTVVGQGTVAKSPDQPQYNHGTVVTLTATPAVGWHFLGWSGDAAGAASPVTVTMDAAKSVTATFAINSYPLTVTVVGQGTVAKSPDQPQYDHGTVVTLTATPALNWHFTGWSGAATGATNPVTVTMDAVKSVTATFAINSYPLAVTVVGQGTVTKSPDQPQYDHGTVVTLTATPAVGWHFLGWSGAATGAASPVTVTMDAAKSVTATFAINTYPLTVTIRGGGSVTNSPDLALYDHGTVVTLTATPAAGYHLIGWSGDATGNTSPVTVTMDAAKSVTVSFGFTLDVSAVGGGSVAKSPDQPLYDPGTAVTLTATPQAFHHFLGWSGDATGTANPLDVTADRDQAITGNFAIDTYPLAVVVVGQGAVVKGPDQPQYDYGTVVTLTATPATGWHFSGWSGDATGATSPVTVTADAAKSVTATFAINSYPLSVTVAGQGSVAKSPDQPQYDHGTVVTLTATPAVGWHFMNWSGNASGAVNPLAVTMTGPTDIKANFAINTYALNVTVAGSGAVTRSPNLAAYDHGTAVTLTAIPATGWHFTGWSGDATGAANPVVVTMDGVKSVTATFVINSYPLDVAVSGQGAAVKSPDQPAYDHGTPVTLTATPAPSWHFVGWSGDTSGATNPLTIIMTRSRSVTATFQIDTYVLTAGVTGSGSVVKTPDLPAYDAGAVVQLAVVPATGWHFTGWSGAVSGTITPVSLTMDAPKSVTAAFAIDQEPLAVGVTGNGAVAQVPNQPVYAYGTVVQLTATPATGWQFTGWSGDASGAANPLALTMDAPKNVTATFTIRSYPLAVTLAGTGAGAVAKSPDQPLYDHGTVVQLTATPALGSTFGGWSGAVSGATNPASLTMDAAKSVTATFTANLYMLTVNSGPNGSVTKSPNQATYTYGAVVQLTAVPAAGYHLVNWGGAASGSANPLPVTMDTTKTISATFAINTYTLTVVTVGTGSVTRAPNTATYTHGTVVTLTATPGANYHFTSWSGGVTGTTSPVNVTMTSDLTVTATFDINTFAVNTTVSPAGSGSVTRNPNQAQYAFGSTVQLTAVPATGYHFTSWSGDASGSTNPVTVTVNATRNVTATFAINTYTLTITKVGQGSVNKSPNSATYTHGQIVTLTANASGGMRFGGWTGDTTATTNPLPLPMIANRTITAHFVEAQPPIVLTNVPNGGESWAIGSTATLTWTASDNVGVSAVDLMICRSGPTGPWEPIAMGIPNTGTFDWVVVGPSTASATAYVLVKVYDAAGNTATDESDGGFTIAPPTAAVETGPVVAFALTSVTPNPAAGGVHVGFAVPEATRVRLTIVDVQGRTVATLADGVRPPGRYDVPWQAGRRPAGVYFVRLEGGGRQFVRRLVLTR